jgi:hypothetical protein
LSEAIDSQPADVLVVTRDPHPGVPPSAGVVPVAEDPEVEPLDRAVDAQDEPLDEEASEPEELFSPSDEWCHVGSVEDVDVFVRDQPGADCGT